MESSGLQRHLGKIRRAGKGGDGVGAQGARSNRGRLLLGAGAVLLGAYLFYLVFAVTASYRSDSLLAGPGEASMPVPQPTTAAGAALEAPMSAYSTAPGAAAEPYGAGGDGGVARQSQGGPPAQPIESWDRMVIRTGTLNLSVEDVGVSGNLVAALTLRYGGRVMQMDTRREGEHMISTITIQVPSQEFDRVLPELRTLGGTVKKILAENIGSQDVTEEFTDLQSQLRNLQAAETRLLALYQRAEKVEDILALDRELRQIRGEIERLQGRANYLSKRSEMSTVTVTLSPVALASPTPFTTEPKKAWDPGEIALRAWNASLDLLTNVGTVAITIAVFLWWLLPVLLIVWVVRRTGRRSAPPAASEPSA